MTDRVTHAYIFKGQHRMSPKFFANIYAILFFMGGRKKWVPLAIPYLVRRCLIGVEKMEPLFWVIMIAALYCAITVVSFCKPLYAMEMHDQVPEITGVPVIDSPRILNWPTDGGNQEPSLGEPTANLVNDLHAEINQCDMVLTTAGNYHMALKDLWSLYLTKFPADGP